MKLIVTSVRIERDTDVAHARRMARVAAQSSGCSVRDQIRFATAVSEIARNALQYAGGGVAEYAFDRSGERGAKLYVRIADKGPGIDNAQRILGGRHKSQTGMGLGLSGSRKLVDEFDLQTGDGGTVVTLGLAITGESDPAALARKAAAAMSAASHESPLDELAEQNRALRDSLAQQEFLVRELHHRTKNNLAVIQSLAIMQARQLRSAEARDALETLTSRIRAFANAHNFLQRAEDVARIALNLHVEELAQQLSVAFGHDIDIVCDVEQVSVSFDTATEIGLVVNELVTNAAKHAFKNGRAGQIRIDAHVDADGLVLRVSDNGPGLDDPQTALRNTRSLGWRIVEGSARKMNSTLDVASDHGLAVTLTIPNYLSD
ncbi:ATP-binding protein [Aurantimonas sp. MSK8Z-1]|uniref:ATP-binding protein n=1 Tax=Mangrovibrevibacter kandeliae TaxID=2968473 RepID=UPI0021198AB4|nr:ATP-binding protein [Aurantimonas sp. MSK8Z-1]MCW4114276.1 ATP-binding protein [Aurantimonas sp. MSK8Z-1]